MIFGEVQARITGGEISGKKGGRLRKKKEERKKKPLHNLD